MTSDDGSRRISSVENAFDIIECLRLEEDATLETLADAVGLTKGTVHTYLATMLDRGYVRKSGRTYHLSLKFLDLGEVVRHESGNIDIICDVLQDIVERTGDIAWFIVEENGEAVFVEGASGENALQPYGSIGKRTTLHDIAGGKAILAHLPHHYLREISVDGRFPERTENTIVDVETLKRELGRIRERGYAINDGENVEGWRAVSAPIFHEGDLLGAIAASGPAHRLRDEWFREELPEIVMDAANEIQLRYLSEG